jgi:hypothetical protein
MVRNYSITNNRDTVGLNNNALVPNNYTASKSGLQSEDSSLLNIQTADFQQKLKLRQLVINDLLVNPRGVGVTGPPASSLSDYNNVYRLTRDKVTFKNFTKPAIQFPRLDVPTETSLRAKKFTDRNRRVISQNNNNVVKYNHQVQTKAVKDDRFNLVNYQYNSFQSNIPKMSRKT